MRVLSWNVYHGRSVPPAGRSLRAEFGAALSGWDWDVALLQEVPPWWVGPLARASGARARRAWTSRNVLPPVQAWLAERLPDLMKSWGGGCNALLVRELEIAEHRHHAVRAWPERRVVHAVRLARRDLGGQPARLGPRAGGGRRGRGPGLGARAGRRRAARARRGSQHSDAELDGFVRAAAGRIDFVYARGLELAGRGEVLDAGALSDHRPIRATVMRP